jgi:hypothetical protein
MPTARPVFLIPCVAAALAACGGMANGDPAGAQALVALDQVAVASGVAMPRFKVDPAWPKMPEQWVIGQVSGISLDSKGNIWVVQRPDSVRGVPAGKSVAPHVLQFAPDGKLLASWGGPTHAPEIDGVNQWPANVHGLFIDHEDNLWIGGNGKGDNIVINLTPQGKYLGQLGVREKTGGNLDKTLLGGPADSVRDGDTVIVADGYTNKRVIVMGAKDKAFRQYWSAFGTEPNAPARQGDFDQSMASSNADGGANIESRSFGDIVHCVTLSKKGELYVCDRRNNRVQIYRKDASGQWKFAVNLPVAAETAGLRTASDVTFSPDEKYMYIADMQNERVWILLRETNQYLGYFGKPGKAPGEFTWLHSLATDKAGNLYSTEVNGGQRVQKFVLTGIE